MQTQAGVRAHSLENWQTHLGVSYPGKLEYIFVVESEDDPAYRKLQHLASSSSQDVKVHVAGLSTTCSQKIHNLYQGLNSCSDSSRYVLCLDDDVELHPRSLRELVSSLEQDATLFMATGYPFDVPPLGSGLQTYCTLVYHLPLLIAFSVRQRTAFVWGGVVMLRMEELPRDEGGTRHDKYGILEGWRDGGYSDDLILGAKCIEHNLVVSCPSSAIFPQWLEPRYSWLQYWNYLRRQLFVLDTYVGPHNRTVNLQMMLLHVWASASVTAGVMAATWQLMAALCCLAGGLSSASASLQTSPSSSSDCRIWCCQGQTTLVFCVACLYAHAGLYYMTARVTTLFHLLSPDRPRLQPADYNWLKLWAGLLIESAILPACMLYTCSVSHIEWAGVRYFKARGRVARK